MPTRGCSTASCCTAAGGRRLAGGQPGDRAAPFRGGRRDGQQRARRLSPLAGSERIRSDVRVPVLTLQSETDVFGLGSIAARQPDSDRFRLWEIAGAAHADTYLLVASGADDGTLQPAALAKLLAPTDTVFGMKMDSPINAGPQQHYVLQAALAHLDRWAGGAPPRRRRRASSRATAAARSRSTSSASRGAGSARRG